MFIPKTTILAIRYLLVTASLFSLAACNSTVDLEPDSKSSHQLALNATKTINKRLAVTANVNYAPGDANQTLNRSGDGQAIQIDDVRFVGNAENPLEIDYDFDLITSSLLLDIYAVNGDFYTLVISPGISYFDLNLDIDVGNDNQFNRTLDSFGYGIQIQNNFALSEKLSLNINIARFENTNNDVGNLVQLNGSLDYALRDNLILGLGYQYTLLNDPTSADNNNDGCDVDALAVNCMDSEVDLQAEGLLLQLKYIF